MLRRIILIAAIVAALAAVVVNIAVVRPKIVLLQTDRDNQRNQKDEYHRDLVKTQNDLKTTTAELNQTKSALADSESARDALTHKLADANTQIDDLNQKLTKTTSALNDASDQLAAYKATGLKPQEVIALDKNLRDTQNALAVANDEKTVLTHEVAKLQTEIDIVLKPGFVVKLPPGLKGTVMAVDPKWNFVVLNIGENQGVLPQGELLVSREGKLVAKVIVSSVQKDRCIANLVPGWQLGDIIEGDEVIPAHPAT
jgi:FtsZ-interacting cell division protein ZipA